ncbi:hypothetical protein INT43_001025 [Umbelopsis isabellina]|uniref:alpha-1,2-Mannosidase n=1 Tax=Mortierella isabellina TaxID=91625 RepID=A0A8H7PK75_MORIS|nr:hypothetical protein INT43_001025 [Umbelopsis isabellina]
MDHLSCFVPGMLAIGSRIFEDPEDLVIAEGLLETCVHMYLTSNTGLSPETWTFQSGKPWDPTTYKRYSDWRQASPDMQNRLDLSAALKKLDNAIKEQVNDLLDRAVDTLEKRKFGPRLSGIFTGDGSYLLRPETVESLFVLYRVTGNPKYQEYGWEIWQAIEKYCKTDSAYTAVRNVNFDISNMHPRAISSIHKDSMESFFFAETLKYLYLLFSSPEVISLDKYVFNTEAHPFLRRSNNFDTQVLSSPRA